MISRSAAQWHTMRLRVWRARLFFAVAIPVLVLDQVSKIWIEFFSGLPRGFYPPVAGIEVIPGFFNIVYNTNTGAAWGILAGQSFWLMLFAIVALILIYFVRKHLFLHLKQMQVAIGLLCGGICGNLIDRAWHGYVIDFLDFIIFGYRWPTFNVADMGISIGVALYILFSYKLEVNKSSNSG